MTLHLDSEANRLFTLLTNLGDDRVYRFPPYNVLWIWMSNIEPAPSTFELKLACNSCRDLLAFLGDDS